jgi:Tfp pilus assembly protein PilF
MAMVLSSVGDFGGAIAHIEHAVRFDPQSVRKLVLYADLLQHTNQLNRAVEMYKRALALAPDDKDIKAKLSTLGQ